MRYLKFNVKEQRIIPNSIGETEGLVAGTRGYLGAKFSFSEAWNGCAKVVAFYDKDGREFSPVVLGKDGSCIIPSDVLEYHEFKMRLFGKNNEYQINTCPITIKQHGGK